MLNVQRVYLSPPPNGNTRKENNASVAKWEIFFKAHLTHQFARCNVQFMTCSYN